MNARLSIYLHKVQNAVYPLRRALADASDATDRLFEPGMTFRRYPDGCYAVVIGDERGPCGNSKRTAHQRYLRSGLIDSADSGK